jgi:anthranilate phosphoribosyltransferase
MLPGLLHTRRVRKDLVLRTPLSTLEKLLAPAHGAVVLGAMGGPVLGTAVEVIQALGHPRGVAVQGVDGGVVPWVARRTRGVGIEDGHLVPVVVEPTDFGLEHDSEPELPMYGPPEDDEGACDNPALVETTQAIAKSVLAGDRGVAHDAVVLGAAVILKAGGQALTLAEGVDQAAAALDSGAARERVEQLKGLLDG